MGALKAGACVFPQTRRWCTSPPLGCGKGVGMSIKEGQRLGVSLAWGPRTDSSSRETHWRWRTVLHFYLKYGVWSPFRFDR